MPIKKTRVIGLTGGIATGKTTLAKILLQEGADIIIADNVGRSVLSKGSAAYNEITEHFGLSILDRDGEINRSRLAKIVFENSEARIRLNKATHQRMLNSIIDGITKLRKKSSECIVIEAAVLFEMGLRPWVDEVWVTATSDQTQLTRLMERDGLSFEQAKSRLDSQMSMLGFIKLADRVIWTDRESEDIPFLA